MHQLIEKMHDTCLEGAHVSPTSNANKGNNFYVMKEDTRVDGPWSDQSVATYVPLGVRNMILKPWQNQVLEWSKEPDDRTVHVIFDEIGNIGKSKLVTYLCTKKLACRIPPMEHHKDVMRACLDRISTCYLIDLPRAMDKRRMNSMWAAIETIKDGYAYDDRYRYREQYFEPPCVVVFTNILPDPAMLSRDRWSIWYVANDRLTRTPTGESTPPASQVY